MAETADRETAHEPQELEQLLIARQHAGDFDGMVALYEVDAVLDPGDRKIRKGRDEIRTFFVEEDAAGKRYKPGDQRPAIIRGDLALTSTHLPEGDITAEVARRQKDGSWLWVIDIFSLR